MADTKSTATAGPMEQCCDEQFGNDLTQGSYQYVLEGAIRECAREQDAIRAELLAALERAADAIDLTANIFETDGGPGAPTLRDAEKQARAAIARARGGAA